MTDLPHPRILIVDDDRALLRSIAGVLSKQHYRVLEATTGADGQRLALTEQPDLVILDVDLPDSAGTQICAELRQRHFTAPILMVTGLHEVENRVHGLESGADDYLPKPFDDRELIARVSALLRRQRRATEKIRTVICGDVRINFERGTATKGNEPLSLTKTEFGLLALLAREGGRPVSRKTILDTVWGYTRTPNTRTVDTHVWRLRKKMGDTGDNPRWLKLVAGQGYCLADCVTNLAPEAGPPK